MLTLRVVECVRDVSRYLLLVIYEINYREVYMNACYLFGARADLLL